jgi:hypothetical protein
MYQKISGSFLPSSHVISGLAQERLRLARAVLEVLELAVVAPERGRLELRGHHAGAPVEGVHDGSPVDGVGEGLADTLVLELLHLVVEGDVPRRVRRTQEELEIRVALDHRDVVGVEAFHAVDLAGLERAQPLRVVLDVAHDHALDLGLRAPEIRIRLEDDLLVGLPLHEPVGPGAHGVLAEVGAPALHRLGAGDVEDEHRQIREEGRLRLLQGDAHGVGVDGLHGADDRLVVEAAELRLPVLEGLAGLDLVVVLGVTRLPPPLEVPDDRGGVERRAVVELHVGAEPERPHAAIGRDLPLLGQCSLDLGGRALVLHETVEDLPRDARGDPVGDDRGIELDRLTLSPEDERLSRRRGDGAQQGESDQGRERGEPHGDAPP